MKRAVRHWAAMLLLVLSQTAQAQGTHTEPSVTPLFVRASLNTAGPYGESWYLMLGPDGAVALQVFYSSNPSGSLMARFQLSAERLGAIREASETEHFFDLPAQLEPEERQFHRPNVQLEFHLGGRHHKVSLYDPPALKSHAATKRFRAVWDALFAGLPMRPSW